MDAEAVRRALRQDDDLQPAATDVVLADIRRRAGRARRRNIAASAAAVALIAAGTAGIALVVGDTTTRHHVDPTPVAPAAGTGFRPTDVEVADSRTWFVLGSADEVCEALSCIRLSRTTDGGQSFTSLAPPGYVTGITFGSPSSGLAWSAGSGELWATDDGGQTWRPRPLPPSTVVLDAWPTKDDSYLVFVDGEGGRRLLALTDGDLVASDYPAIQHEEHVTVASTTTSTYVAGRFQTGRFAEDGQALVFRSGTRIEHPCSPASRPDITAVAGTLWIMCNDGKIGDLHRSTDQGQTWTNAGSAPSGSILFAVTKDQAGVVPPGSTAIIEPTSGKQAVAPPWTVALDVATADGIALLAASDAMIVSRHPGHWEYVDGFSRPDLLPDPKMESPPVTDHSQPAPSATSEGAWPPEGFNLTRCADVPPIAEPGAIDDFTVDDEYGILTFSYPTALGERTVDIAYLRDKHCRERPDIRQIIQRVQDTR